jgi:predicted RNA-binding protein with PIN domain
MIVATADRSEKWTILGITDDKSSTRRSIDEMDETRDSRRENVRACVRGGHRSGGEKWMISGTNG